MNKEDKYREEIFKVLEGALEGIKKSELELLQELFLNESIDVEEVVRKIKEVK